MNVFEQVNRRSGPTGCLKKYFGGRRRGCVCCRADETRHCRCRCCGRRFLLNQKLNSLFVEGSIRRRQHDYLRRLMMTTRRCRRRCLQRPIYQRRLTLAQYYLPGLLLRVSSCDEVNSSQLMMCLSANTCRCRRRRRRSCWSTRSSIHCGQLNLLLLLLLGFFHCNSYLVPIYLKRIDLGMCVLFSWLLSSFIKMLMIVIISDYLEGMCVRCLTLMTGRERERNNHE